MINKTDDDIHIRVLEANDEHLLSTHANEYRNLMQIIHDRVYPEGFGECNGMGRCGTCLVNIVKSETDLPLSDRNEATTLRKIGITDTTIRLACQILISSQLNGSIIKVV